jgi:hypothetical protein
MGFFATLGKKSGLTSLGQKAVGGIRKGVKVVESEASKIENVAKSVENVAGKVSGVAGAIGVGAGALGLAPVAAAALAVSGGAKAVEKGAGMIEGVAGRVENTIQTGRRMASATDIGLQSAARGLNTLRRGDISSAVKDARMVGDAAKIAVTDANLIRKQIQRNR